MKYTPVMTLRVETAGAPQIPSARGTKSACGRRASAVGMLFYEIVETAQAILVTYILTDVSSNRFLHRRRYLNLSELILKIPITPDRFR